MFYVFGDVYTDVSERLSSPPMNSRPAKVKNERNMIPPSTLTKKNSPKKWETAETKPPFFSGFPEKNKTLPQGTPFFPRHHERRRGQMTALCVFYGVFTAFYQKTGPWSCCTISVKISKALDHCCASVKVATMEP